MRSLSQSNLPTIFVARPPLAEVEKGQLKPRGLTTGAAWLQARLALFKAGETCEYGKQTSPAGPQ